MYHYQKNIGDYRSATMHLSLLEHGVYNQLLDWYYLDEAPLSLDNRTLFRRLSARSEVEQQAVLDVLTEMFVQTDGGWVHKRVEREISQYKAKANQAREAGKLGGRPPKKGVGFSENRDGSETKPDAKPTANQEPLTKNQEPINTTPPEGGVSRKRSAATTAARPDDVSEPVWQDFQRLRREKRAPLTDTALAGVRKEAEKAGVPMDLAVAYCCEAGWQTFNAGWYADRQGAARGTAATGETAYQRSMRERIEEAAPSIARRAPAQQQDATDYFRTVDVPARDVTRHAIEVQP